MNNVTTWPEQNNGMFNNLPDATAESNFIDPSMFGSGNLDLNNLPNNSQFHPRLQNGAARNPYQVNSMVPSKRPREDSTGALSRSQTPAQQGQFGFQGNQHGGPQPLQVPPSPFPHLQGGSGNATPSPTMQNQHFRPGAPPQRVNTVSPAQNPNVPQMSPMNYMQGSPMPPQYSQNFGGSFPVQPVALSQNLQNRQQEAQRQYQMRLQAQQQQLAASNMAAQQGRQMGPMLGSTGQQPGMQMNRNPAQMQNQQQARNSMDTFMKNLTALMQQIGRPFNPQPLIGGRPVNLLQLYSSVMKQKGSKRVTAMNAWSMIAQMMGFAPQQFPGAGEELRMAYEQNLGPYEAAYMSKMQQAKMGGEHQQAQMAAMSAGQQMSPTKPMPQMGANNLQAQQQQYLQQLQRTQAMQQQQQQQQQVEHSTPMKSNAAIPNGWSTPQMDKMTPNAQALQNQHRKSLSRQLEATPPQGQTPGFPSPSPAPTEKKDIPPGPPTANGITNNFDSKFEHGPEYTPKARQLGDSHGGIDVIAMGELGSNIAKLKPNVPQLDEMGVIDIRALTMSIQSGIHGEVRLALDILAKLSHEQRLTLELARCEDLVDVLVDCAEDQLDALAEDSPEVSDILDLTPYEDVIRNSRIEIESIQNIHEFGTPEYDLDRTADKLIAITTILRNLSFFEFNHPLLSSPQVLKLLSNAIRLVGTRILLLRTHVNTADFMKDLITFFSNISDKIELPSREEASHILHFLVAFAPCPRPNISTTGPIRFTPYNPSIHRYLPPAVDSLAKLLARDDPNRTHYKNLFASEATSTPPYDLLTRAFALAISVVPDRSNRHIRGGDEKRIAEARKPFLMQGMLAADILASLAPGSDAGIARMWLDAEDGWAPSLLRLSVFLCGNPVPPPQGQPGPRGRGAMVEDSQGFQLIIHRALSMLKKLGEKSKGEVLVKNDAEDAEGTGVNGHPVEEGSGENGVEQRGEREEEEGGKEMVSVSTGLPGSRWRVKADVLPKKEVLLGALLTPNIDQVALRQLCSYGGLDDF